LGGILLKLYIAEATNDAAEMDNQKRRSDALAAALKLKEDLLAARNAWRENY
jgi:hypothetical protein